MSAHFVMHYHSVVQLQMLRHCFCLGNAHSTVRCGVYIFYCGVTVMPKLSTTLYVSPASYHLHCWTPHHHTAQTSENCIVGRRRLATWGNWSPFTADWMITLHLLLTHRLSAGRCQPGEKDLLTSLVLYDSGDHWPNWYDWWQQLTNRSAVNAAWNVKPSQVLATVVKTKTTISKNSVWL